MYMYYIHPVKKSKVQQFIKNELSKYCKDGTYIDDIVGSGSLYNVVLFYNL